MPAFAALSPLLYRPLFSPSFTRASIISSICPRVICGCTFTKLAALLLIVRFTPPAPAALPVPFSISHNARCWFAFIIISPGRAAIVVLSAPMLAPFMPPTNPPAAKCLIGFAAIIEANCTAPAAPTNAPVIIPATPPCANACVTPTAVFAVAARIFDAHCAISILYCISAPFFFASATFF